MWQVCSHSTLSRFTYGMGKFLENSSALCSTWMHRSSSLIHKSIFKMGSRAVLLFIWVHMYVWNNNHAILHWYPNKNIVASLRPTGDFVDTSMSSDINIQTCHSVLFCFPVLFMFWVSVYMPIQMGGIFWSSWTSHLVCMPSPFAFFSSLPHSDWKWTCPSHFRARWCGLLIICSTTRTSGSVAAFFLSSLALTLSKPVCFSWFLKNRRERNKHGHPRTSAVRNLKPSWSWESAAPLIPDHAAWGWWDWRPSAQASCSLLYELLR